MPWIVFWRRISFMEIMEKIRLFNIYEEYLSPSTDDSNWHLKKASSTGPTTLIVLSSPYSGEPSQFRIGTITPSMIEKKEQAGTVTYSFGISASASVYAEAASVTMSASSYVTWSISVYYYKFGWRQHTEDTTSWYGEVTGDLEFGRSFTGGVAMAYLSSGEQSIHYSFEGKFHHDCWYDPFDDFDSDITLNGDFTIYLGGGGGGVIE